MSWRDRLKQGSFRGVPFDYHGGSVEFGRRGPVVELPAAEGDGPGPIDHDLGRRAWRIQVRCSVFEPDYTNKRLKLIEAIETRGPGRLVHPTLGEFKCVVKEPASSSEDIDQEGGRSTFTIPFVVVKDDARFPQGIADTRGRLRNSVADFLDVAKLDFLDKFSVDGYTGFVAEAATLVAGSLSSTMNTLAGPFAATENLFASLRSNISTFQSSLSNLVQSPGDMFDEMLSLAGEFSELVGASDGRDAIKRLQLLFNAGDALDDIVATTLQTYAQAANQDALDQLNKRLALAQQALTAARIDYEAYDDALSDRDAMLNQIESLAQHEAPTLTGELSSIDDHVFYGLQDLRAAVLDDFNNRAANLPGLVEFLPMATMPALVAAHYLYGDATRADEIVKRNNIEHPGFLSGGVDFRVLADV